MISWKGLSAYKAKLKGAPTQLRNKSVQDVERWGRNTAVRTQEGAPVDLGKLIQSVNYEATDRGMGAKVSINVPYAAFIEFGTGAGVLIPPGWEEVAARFRGNGERKVTIQAHSFFIPVVNSETDRLKARLRYNLRTLL